MAVFTPPQTNRFGQVIHFQNKVGADVLARNRQIQIDEFRVAQEKANAANEARFTEGKSIFDDLIKRFQFGAERSPDFQKSQELLSRNIQEFQPGGAIDVSGRADIADSQRIARSNAFQRLVSSGLANLTGSFDIQAGKSRTRQLQDLSSRLAVGRTGARTTQATSLSAADRTREEQLRQTALGKIGFIERREDIGPDLNQFSQLLAQGSAA